MRGLNQSLLEKHAYIVTIKMNQFDPVFEESSQPQILSFQSHKCAQHNNFMQSPILI